MSVILKKEGNFRISSKPTEWDDGDLTTAIGSDIFSSASLSSEPTAWDGDVNTPFIEYSTKALLF